MFDLHGRVAVITGASGGLGRQFALALAGQGADIVILARREKEMEEVAQEVRAKGVKCAWYKTDVTDSAQVKAAAEAALKQFGKIDILVNNAGGGAAGGITEMDDATWSSVTALDLDGVFFCMREFCKPMLEAGYGRVINIGSILGHGGLPELPVAPYTAAKGAVINLTRHAAAEFSRAGITVNALCPGFFPSRANPPEAMEAMDYFISARTPMGRPGVDGELDSAVIYLAADESSYVTGSITYVDGGWSCV